MTKLDTICARLRDVGVFLIGISAIVISAYFIYESTHSPEAQMQRSIQQLLADGMLKSRDDPSR